MDTNRIIKQVLLKRKIIEDLKEQSNELYEDIKISQDLLFIILFEEYEMKGFKEKVEVIYKPTKTKHKISGFFLDRETNKLVANLEPIPKMGFGKFSYVDDMKLIIKKKVK